MTHEELKEKAEELVEHFKWRHSTNIAKENKLKEFILTYNLEAETLD